MEAFRALVVAVALQAMCLAVYYVWWWLVQ